MVLPTFRAMKTSGNNGTQWDAPRRATGSTDQLVGSCGSETRCGFSQPAEAQRISAQSELGMTITDSESKQMQLPRIEMDTDASGGGESIASFTFAE
jgi:hypothetical protein